MSEWLQAAFGGGAAALVGLGQAKLLQESAAEGDVSRAALNEQRLASAQQRQAMAAKARQDAADQESLNQPTGLYVPGTAKPEQDAAGPPAPGQTPGSAGGVQTAPANPGTPVSFRQFNQGGIQKFETAQGNLSLNQGKLAESVRHHGATESNASDRLAEKTANDQAVVAIRQITSKAYAATRDAKAGKFSDVLKSQLKNLDVAIGAAQRAQYSEFLDDEHKAAAKVDLARFQRQKDLLLGSFQSSPAAGAGSGAPPATPSDPLGLLK